MPETEDKYQINPKPLSKPVDHIKRISSPFTPEIFYSRFQKVDGLRSYFRVPTLKIIPNTTQTPGLEIPDQITPPYLSTYFPTLPPFWFFISCTATRSTTVVPQPLLVGGGTVVIAPVILWLGSKQQCTSQM